MRSGIAELSEAGPAAFAHVHTVLTDIDDTLTTEGRLTARAYAAIEAMDREGLRVIPVTGRPAGWCDMIARFWPVAGVVGENGAFAFHYDRERQRMSRWYESSREVRAERRARLDALTNQILAEFPGTTLAADQPFRLADVAVDVCEDVAPLSDEMVARIVERFREGKAQAKLSSIHVNAWFGAYDKLTTVTAFLADRFYIDLAGTHEGVAFIGDSPNDEPLFGAVHLSVGVANVKTFLPRMRHKPRFLTNGRGGDGFAEFSDTILSARERGAGGGDE